MIIYSLQEIPAELLDDVGGKARGLHRQIKAGLNVPDGFILYKIESGEDIEKAARYYEETGFGNVAVRSSAAGEDGADFSNAGQFSTFLNVNGKSEFIAAVKNCIASLENETAQQYARTFLGDTPRRMTVVVQKMVDARAAGVCFTKNPAGSGGMLIEAVAGLGESLVSGHEAARQYKVRQEGDVFSIDSDSADTHALLSDEQVRAICRDARVAKEYFGIELDMEWAIDQRGVLCWLQARPITGSDMPTIDEFDYKGNLDGQVITTCNVREMLPGAVTPLSLSTSVYAIDHGMRRTFVNSGAYKTMDDIPEGACIVSVQNHLFINLSVPYMLGKKIMGANKESVELSICGRTLAEAPDIDAPDAPFPEKIINLFKYASMLMTKNKAVKKLSKMAASFSLPLADDIFEQYAIIEKGFPLLYDALYYHTATSAFSGSMSSAISIVVKDDFASREELASKIAGVLENIDDIESVDILRSLRNAAACLKEENPAIVNYTQEQIADFIDSCGQKSKDAIDLFMKRHGHRAIREVELRSGSMRSDKIAFTNYLQAVLSAPPEEKNIDKDNWRKNRDKFLAPYRGTKKRALKFLIDMSREGARRREATKSGAVKIIDQYKYAYNHLAAMLVKKEMLPDPDLIFFLTHKEIGDLITNNNSALIKKAIARRRLLDRQKLLSFPEISIGKPKPIPEDNFSGALSELQGVPVSNGSAAGKARVVTSIEDANKLEHGEIMIAAFVDIGWSPYYCKIGALVTEIGSALSHGAVVAREYALPVVVNITHVTKIIKTGDYISINGSTGVVSILESA